MTMSIRASGLSGAELGRTTSRHTKHPCCGPVTKDRTCRVVPPEQPPANCARSGVLAFGVELMAARRAVLATVLTPSCAAREIQVEPCPEGYAELWIREVVVRGSGLVEPRAGARSRRAAAGRRSQLVRSKGIEDGLSSRSLWGHCQ